MTTGYSAAAVAVQTTATGLETRSVTVIVSFHLCKARFPLPELTGRQLG